MFLYFDTETTEVSWHEFNQENRKAGREFLYEFPVFLLSIFNTEDTEVSGYGFLTRKTRI